MYKKYPIYTGMIMIFLLFSIMLIPASSGQSNDTFNQSNPPNSDDGGFIDSVLERIAHIEDILTNPVTASMSPYTALLGSWAYAMIWFFIVGMVYIKTDRLSVVMVLSLVFFSLYPIIFAPLGVIRMLFSIIAALILTSLLMKIFYGG